MSDAKKFAKTTLSPEDRLEDVERKFDVIIQRIQAYDRVLEEFSSLKAQVANCQQIVRDAFSDFQKSKQDFNQSSVSLKAQQANVSVKLAALDGADQSTIQKIDQVEQFMKYANLQLRSDLDQLSSRPVFDKKAHEKISDLSQDTKESLDGVISVHKSLNKDLAGCNEKIEYLASQIQNILATRNDMKDQFAEFTKANKASHANSVNELKDVIQTRDGVMKCYVQQKIEELSQKISAMLPEKTLKDDLIKKIESVSMDGANAFLKSDNTAKQVLILEKKLENISLLLKKHELNK